MNYMPEVLKMLGVEVGERFNIVDQSCNPYLFDEGYNLIDMEYYTRNGLIRGLIIGDLKIEKLPWKPKEGERYQSVLENGKIKACEWQGSDVGYYRYNAGNCFKLSEEITPEIKERILREMKGKYENEC